jgi:hypothetical protein
MTFHRKNALVSCNCRAIFSGETEYNQLSRRTSVVFEFDKAGNKGYRYCKTVKIPLRGEATNVREHSHGDFQYRLHCIGYLCSVSDGQQWQEARLQEVRH